VRAIKSLPALILIVCLWIWRPSHAQTSGPIELSVSGVVATGTANGPSTTGLPITLHVIDGQTQAARASYQAVTGSDGAFAFSQVAANVQDVIFVSVVYVGVPQSSALVKLTAQNSLNLPLVVYAPSNDASLIVLSEAQYLLDLQPGGLLQVLATYSFRNPSDQLYISQLTTTDGRRVSTVAPLPIGAVGVAFEAQERFVLAGEASAPVVQDTRPVFPGQTHQMIFSYQVPYAQGAIIDMDLPFFTEAVRILIPDDIGVLLKPESTDAKRPPFNAAANVTLNPNRPYTEYTLSAPLGNTNRLIYELAGAKVSATTPKAVAGTSNIGSTINTLLLMIVGVMLLFLGAIGLLSVLGKSKRKT
jgi:hypothetical protein